MDDAGQLDSPAGVLPYARARKAEQDAGERGVLLAAAAWAEQHSTDALIDSDDWTYARERSLPLGGVGVPEVTEFAVPELAAALGMSTDAGRRFLGEVVEARYRLPLCWGEFTEGRVPA